MPPSNQIRNLVPKNLSYPQHQYVPPQPPKPTLEDIMTQFIITHNQTMQRLEQKLNRLEINCEWEQILSQPIANPHDVTKEAAYEVGT